MRIGKTGKILLLLASVFPIAYMFTFMAFIFVTMFTAASGKNPGNELFDFFPVLIILHFAVILLSFALIAFYIYYVFTTDRIEKDKKVLWAVVIFLGSFFAMPVFWYLYIWREPKSTLPSVAHAE